MVKEIHLPFTFGKRNGWSELSGQKGAYGDGRRVMIATSLKQDEVSTHACHEILVPR